VPYICQSPTRTSPENFKGEVILRAQSGNITVSLPDHLQDFSYYSAEHVIVYVQNDFLEAKSYETLVSELEALFDRASFKATRENKMWYRVQGHQKLPANLPRSVRSFCSLFRSRRFRKWFLNTHEGFFERGCLKSVFPRTRLTMRLALHVNKVARRSFGFKLWNVYSSSVEFSFLPEGGAVPPHTDSAQKRLALVFFTPFGDVSDDMRTMWGTEFWRGRMGEGAERSWQTNTKVGKEMDAFVKRHEIFLKVPYEANTICGFVKSETSWHSVAPNPLTEDRVAVVINVWDRAALE